MSHLIGRRGYSRETYPTSPGSGGGASNAPLSRQRFIDGGTAAAGPGAASAPFATIADFIASRPVGVSAQDSVANYVGWLMPCLVGYTEDVSFPPYVSTELRADSFSPVAAPAGGTVITGDLTWDNTGGSNAGDEALVVLHNISSTGDMSILDDVNAPVSAVVFSGDESPQSSSAIGAVDCRTTVKLLSITFNNTTVNNINADNTRADAAVAIMVGSSLTGVAAAKAFVASDSTISASVISAFVSANFAKCSFSPGTIPTVTAPFAGFDSTSWNSFLEAGGIRGVGTVALVEGGSSGALVEGAALPASGAVSVSIDGTGATAGYTGEHCGNHYSTPAAFSGDITVTLKTGGALKVGDTMLITKSDLTAHLLVVHNNAGGQIATVPTLARGFVLARYNGTDWIFVSGGSLLA